MLRQHVKEIHWLRLKCLYKQQRSVGTLGTEVLAGDIFTLSLYLSGAACLTPASSGGLVHSARCSPMIPPKLTGLCSLQGTALQHLAPVAREPCISELHGTATAGQRVPGRLPPSGYYKNSRMKHS